MPKFIDPKNPDVVFEVDIYHDHMVVHRWNRAMSSTSTVMVDTPEFWHLKDDIGRLTAKNAEVVQRLAALFKEV